jgi:hypothetical protein
MHMNKESLNMYIGEQYSQNQSLPDIYHQLIQTVPKEQAAIAIAMFIPPENKMKNISAIGFPIALIILVLCLTMYILGYNATAAEQLMVQVSYVVAMVILLSMTVGLLWGLCRFKVWALNIAVVGSLLGLFISAPVGFLSAGLTTGYAILPILFTPIMIAVLTIHARKAIYPFLGFFGPKKSKAGYAFLDAPEDDPDQPHEYNIFN